MQTPSPEGTAPVVSLLIPAYNEEALLPGVLALVHASFAAIGFTAYEVVVCDNHSTDRTGEVAGRNGAKVVYEEHNQIARARNTAARGASGQWLIFLDADTLLSSELLRETLDCFEAGTVCAGGAGLRFDLPKVGPFAAGMTWVWNHLSRTLGLAAGSYVFCYREAWEAVGGFDERVYAGEELFFSQRLKRWARQHGKCFRILTDHPVVTSARKVEWYGQWGLIWRCLLMIRPNAVKSREACALWYTRPSAEEAKTEG